MHTSTTIPIALHTRTKVQSSLSADTMDRSFASTAFTKYIPNLNNPAEQVQVHAPVDILFPRNHFTISTSSLLPKFS